MKSRVPQNADKIPGILTRKTPSRSLMDLIVWFLDLKISTNFGERLEEGTWRNYMMVKKQIGED